MTKFIDFANFKVQKSSQFIVILAFVIIHEKCNAFCPIPFPWASLSIPTNVFNSTTIGVLFGLQYACLESFITIFFHYSLTEPIRKRVHAKERVPLFQMLNQSSAAAVSTSKPMQLNTPPRVRHSLSQPLPGSHNQQSTFLRAPLPPPLLPNAGLVKVVGHNGVVRWAYRPETESSQKTTIVSSGDSNMSHTVGQQQQQTSLIRVPISSSQSNTTDVNLDVNPVQQTLALLGIRTPLRRTEAATYALPAPNVSSDQMRRRLAIRETSATSLRINHAAPNPTVLSSAASAGPNFDPEAVRARLVLPREGYEIVSRDSVGSQAGLVQFHHTKPYSGPSTNPG